MQLNAPISQPHCLAYSHRRLPWLVAGSPARTWTCHPGDGSAVVLHWCRSVLRRGLVDHCFHPSKDMTAFQQTPYNVKSMLPRAGGPCHPISGFFPGLRIVLHTSRLRNCPLYSSLARWHPDTHDPSHVHAGGNRCDRLSSASPVQPVRVLLVNRAVNFFRLSPD